jgi:hypothetical protein
MKLFAEWCKCICQENPIVTQIKAIAAVFTGTGLVYFGAIAAAGAVGIIAAAPAMAVLGAGAAMIWSPVGKLIEGDQV